MLEVGAHQRPCFRSRRALMILLQLQKCLAVKYTCQSPNITATLLTWCTAVSKSKSKLSELIQEAAGGRSRFPLNV